MEKFIQHQGLVGPIDRAHVDTDQIIPKQFLKSIERTGFGKYLFDEWRYQDEGYPGQDCTNRPLKKEFSLNLPQYQGASILLARENFGCGSSREHAPWAIRDFGFRAMIAPSFAEIFFNNSCKNGLVPVVLSHEVVDLLFQKTYQEAGFSLDINLEMQKVTLSDGTSFDFQLDERLRHQLLNGLDEIGMTLAYQDQIQAFEQQHQKLQPWLFNEPVE